MLFIHPMWDHESQRIGKQKCTPIGHAIHGVAELIGFVGLLLLFVAPVVLAWRWFAGTFHAPLLWLLAVPPSFHRIVPGAAKRRQERATATYRGGGRRTTPSRFADSAPGRSCRCGSGCALDSRPAGDRLQANRHVVGEAKEARAPCRREGAGCRKIFSTRERGKFLMAASTRASASAGDTARSSGPGSAPGSSVSCRFMMHQASRPA